MKKPLTYISLFSSAGVGCFGFKLTGYECIATNEMLAKRLTIQKYNKKCRFTSGYIDGDISTDETKQKLDKELNKWKTKFKIKEPDVIIATPPCQGMSVANHKKGNEINRNSLVVESISITKKYNPKFFVFENVRSFLNTECTDVDGINKPIRNAIESNLSGNYNILFKIVNFKNHGSNSSRTRTLVIGVRKDLSKISPYDILPKEKESKVLRQMFQGLKELTSMGEIDSQDIYHSYRNFNINMLPWIEKTKEGQSAFENKESSRIPHRIVDGEVVFNKNKNGDKYARWYWDREGPCIHTRNDILASQNTVHPSENRVFSIREIMLMMSIPKSFKWSDTSLQKLNKLTIDEKVKFLKKEELNIRHCLGESVPTEVFSSIAENIQSYFECKSLTERDVYSLIEKNNLGKIEKLLKFINKNFNNYSLEDLFLISELSNSQRLNTSAYFTPKEIGYSVVKGLPSFKGKKEIRILEPSVGVGNFLPLLFSKYAEIKSVIIDVCDIDNNSLKILTCFLKLINPPKNFKVNLIDSDFLLKQFDINYDLVVGNPPFKKVTNNKSLLKSYKTNIFNKNTNNLFAFFIEKALEIGRNIAFIIPKSLINSPEFNKTRTLLLKHNLVKIIDYGEKAFKGVKIETISFLVEKKQNSTEVIIESYIHKSYKSEQKKYVFYDNYPYWLIYRNAHFDNVASLMKLDVFNAFRDRQITKKHTKLNGKIRLLKSRNISNNAVIDIKGYDCYLDDIEPFVVSRYINNNGVVMIPNLTYYPRASFLPKNTIVDGSVALLTLKNGSRKAEKSDLDFYSSEQFEEYYRVARNYGTRSLNIDNNSVFFFGLLK